MANETKNLIKALTCAEIRFKIEVEKMLRNYYASTAPVASLNILGRDRLITRYPLETDDEKYRDRVINAYDENVGRGNVWDIIRVIEGHGFSFLGDPEGFYPGFPAGTPNDKFNLLIRGLGGAVYDATYIYDSTIKYDAVGINSILIEIKGSTTTDEKIALQTQLFKIVRASIKIIKIVDIP